MLNTFPAASEADYEEPYPRNFVDFDRPRLALRFGRYDANELESERRHPSGFIAPVHLCYRTRSRCLGRNDGDGQRHPFERISTNRFV